MTVRPPLAEQLDFQQHPEGGWFREACRSRVDFWPQGYGGSAATAICFLSHRESNRAGMSCDRANYGAGTAAVRWRCAWARRVTAPARGAMSCSVVTWTPVGSRRPWYLAGGPGSAPGRPDTDPGELRGGFRL